MHTNTITDTNTNMTCKAVIDFCAKHGIVPELQVMPCEALSEIYTKLDSANDSGQRCVHMGLCLCTCVLACNACVRVCVCACISAPARGTGMSWTLAAR